MALESETEAHLSHEQTMPAEIGCEMTLRDELARLGSRQEHADGLLYVGLFKLSKFLFFGALGVGALHLIHRNVGEEVMRVVNALPIDPESHLVSVVMDKADLIGGHQLRQFSMATFGYAVLCLIEGTGLMMRRVWAEYFTVTLTVMGLPWEAYELILRFTWLKVGVMGVNVLVLLYLLWILKQKRECEEPT